MDTNVIYSIFLFIVIPLLLTLGFADKKGRKIFGFLIIGITVCLLASELNNIFMKLIDKEFAYYSTTVSPMVEELLKAIPLFFTIFFILDEPSSTECVSIGLAIGVGFAIFENIILYFQGGMDQSLLWSLARGIGAGFMHGICGGALGFGICFVKEIKKGYFFGLFGIVTTIILYHGLFNLLVQSEDLKYFGILLPISTMILLIPMNILFNRRTQEEYPTEKE